MASIDFGTTLQPNGVLDFPLVPKDHDARDLTWNADDIENWSSSTDDDEESTGEVHELPALKPGNDPVPAATGVQSRQTNGPKLSLFPSIMQSQKQWTEKSMGGGSFGPYRSQSSDSDSSLVSIPAIVPRLRETPVPLPSTAGMTTTRDGASPTQFADKPARVAFPSTAPPAPTTELSIKPTPVPLPLFMRTSVPASQPNGQQASDTTWIDSRKPNNKPDEVDVDWAADKTLSTASHQVILGAISQPTFDGAIMYATDGRPYTVFRQPNGEMVSAKGALIPANYKLHHDPVYPFICPVRDCRRTLRTLASLKGHFAASHSTMKYNDNGDGTLTRVGRYKNNAGTSPGIVVSRDPLPVDAEPPVAPRMTDVDQKWATFPVKRVLDEPDMPDTQKFRILPGGRPNTDTLGYLLRIYDEKTMPRRPDITKMNRLPAKRTLPRVFINHHRATLEDPQILACAAAYIAGDEVPSSLACRAAKGPLARLSERCIVLRTTLQLDEEELAMFIPRYMCVGCAYLAHVTGQLDHCALRPENFPARRNNMMLDATSPSMRPLPVDVVPRPALPRMLDSPASSARVSYVGATEQTLATQRPVRQSVLNRLSVDKGNFEAPTRTSTTSPASQPSIGRPKPAPENAAIQAEQLATEDFEMDNWEIAPGRVTSDDLSQNLAYSGPFLSSSTPVTLSPDIYFNVLTIRPGQIFHVTAHKDKIQVFSVASGKVKVTTGGKVVQMGPNGAFPVRPGDTCVIENRNYVAAMVHCTTVKGYELV